jgi:4-hydroxyproline epimerase
MRIEVIDSHTEGEPTRIIVAGGPDLGGGSVATRREVFRTRFDHLRRAVVREPRGADFLVGAMIVPASSGRCVCGVIFFNNVGFLSGCGHGTIGLAATLRHLGRLPEGAFAVETPVGEVGVAQEPDGAFTLTNVPSFRHAKGVRVPVRWNSTTIEVVGDVAWGGNWFFLVKDHGHRIALDNLASLTDFAAAVRAGLDAAGVRGDPAFAGTGIIDHVELFEEAAAGATTRRVRNFVLCPGREYDRSPCGTGTSAKVACLAQDSDLRPGEPIEVESVVGGRFTARYALSVAGPGVIPMVTGRAYITAESTLILNSDDPFRFGIG